MTCWVGGRLACANSKGFDVSRLFLTIGFAALLGAAAPAWAGSQGASHGITGQSPTRASTPASGSRHQITPAKPHNSPPAGVRPHTDLAAATKITALSSANLLKHSQLFPKMPLPPGAPSLAGPVLNNIGPTQGGSASFKAVAGIPTALSNGRVYPTNGGGAGGGKPGHSLTGNAHVMAMAAGETSDGTGNGTGGGWLLLWLKNIACGLGMAGLGWWMWQQAPKSAKVSLPATIPA
jgi:hypothetical protein